MAVSEAPTWHVLGDEITQTTDLLKGGTGIQDVFVIPYRIDSGPAAGHVGTVRVPVTSATSANVAAAIGAQVNDTHGIAGLTG